MPASRPTLELPRRSVLRGLALVVASGVVGFLAARQSTAATTRGAATAANDYGPAQATGERLLAGLDDVPVAGGVVLDDAGVVLTRDPDGTVRGFSATCTHQGCTVSSVGAGTIGCPCHGSRFDATTGAPTAGPATRSLPGVPVVVRDGSVYTA